VTVSTDRREALPPSDSRRRHTGSPRFAIAVGAALLLAVVGGIVGVGLQTDPREARALRTPGAIVGVTYGSRPLVLGANWQKWVLRAFPGLESRVGGHVLIPGFPAQTPVVLWLCDGPRFVDSRPTLPVQLTADTGERMETVATGVSSARPIRGHRIGPLALPTYPRRGRTIRIQPVSYARPAEPVEPRVVANPTPGPFPVWKPEPLPATRRDGPLLVTLRRFRAVSLAADVQACWARAELEVELREGGKSAAQAWAIERLGVTDATGNRWDFPDSWQDPFTELMLWSDPVGRGRRRVWLRPLGLPDEAAYRLRLELTRRAGFPPEELWTLRDVPIPASKQVVNLGRRRTLHGCPLEAVRVIGEDTGVGCAGGWRRVHVRVGPGAEKYVLLMRTSPPGRPASWQPMGIYNGVACVPLLSDGRPRRASLTLALTPRRTVEFLAHAERR
jgi:hypothetical protein